MRFPLVSPLRMACTAWRVYGLVTSQLEALREQKARATTELTLKLYQLLRAAITSAFQVEISGDEVDPTQSALLVCNHQSHLDYLVVASQGPRFVEDAASIFFYVQGKLTRFPSLRWHGPRSIARATTSTPPPGPKMVVVFPEGEPWNEVAFRRHRLECEYAGAPPLNNLLYPRFEPFVEAIELIRQDQMAAAVYSATLTYAGAHKVNIHIQKHTLKSLPTKQHKLERWLEKQWYRKDAFLDSK